MRLQGKVALVTGSSSGIGHSIAVRLAREGADVAVHFNRSHQGAEQTAAEIQKLGRRTLVVGADVSVVSEVQRLVNEVVAHFGQLDILVNNAGMEKHTPFWDITEEEYDRVVDVNLKGVFFGSQAMVRHLRQAGRPGRIINISSVHEDVPFPNFASYCVAKGGVRMLTRTLAVELRGLGITVNGVAPGAILTPINTSLLQDKPKLEALLGKVPEGRLGTPEDVASVVAFLASPEAEYVNGATYFVDGGLSVFYEEQ
jgi:glucose 1-dehydrogenase